MPEKVGVGRIERFEDLIAWQRARRLTQVVYQLTRQGPFVKDVGLAGQMQRAAVSIMSNIAEGFERGGNQEFCQFLYVAKGSCGEVRSQLYIALDQNYISGIELDQLKDSYQRLSSMISNFIAYLKRSGMKGEKFKRPEE